MKKHIFGIIILIVITSCNVKPTGSDEVILARVGNYHLYESELKSIIPPNANPSDSLSLIKNFVNSWIRENLLVYQAENNLTEKQMDFDKQIESYRNSLIIFQYESLLVSQQLDTIVTDEEIESYYDKNRNSFKLRQNIVKVDFVQINLNSPYINKIKSFIFTNNDNLTDSLEIYSKMYADRFFINDDQWLSFDNLMSIIPIKTYNQEAFLKNNRYIEIKEEPYQYFINFLGFSIRNDISPLSFEKENIKSIILNRRKTALINKMHNELFENALNSDIVEIY
ncbi:MAG: hypothetical protein GY834_13770 [Bacteroidetes bacterium]|nr:hypothetical protein [Bacteroidota bacterium]